MTKKDIINMYVNEYSILRRELIKKECKLQDELIDIYIKKGYTHIEEYNLLINSKENIVIDITLSSENEKKIRRYGPNFWIFYIIENDKVDTSYYNDIYRRYNTAKVLLKRNNIINYIIQS